MLVFKVDNLPEIPSDIAELENIADYKMKNFFFKYFQLFRNSFIYLVTMDSISKHFFGSSK